MPVQFMVSIDIVVDNTIIFCIKCIPRIVYIDTGCTLKSRSLCDDIDCIKCYEKSFASDYRSEHWSNINVLSSRQVFKKSGSKYWFVCNVCSHLFLLQLSTCSRNRWCPYCCTPPKKLCQDSSCETCFNKSFASSVHARHYIVDSILNPNSPRQLFLRGTTVVWLLCYNCNHQFDSSLDNLFRSKWCPYCSNPPKALCKNTDCEKCFKKSFASSSRASGYILDSNLNALTPRERFLNANSKGWFKCHVNHVFEIALNKVSGEGGWCPNCRFKTEQIVFDFLTSVYDTKRQVSYKWCKYIGSKRMAVFDFVVESKKVIIEVDGRQHFEQISTWTSPKSTQTNDVYKMKAAIENGYRIIRILQIDVLKNNIVWQSQLLDAIASSDIIVYLSKDTAMYDTYRTLLQ